MKITTFLLMWISCLLAGQTADAQIKVSGTVYGEGEPIQGCIVYEKGTNLGTQADSAGRFSYTCSGEKPVLVFSFVTYKTQEISVATDTVLHVILEPNYDNLIVCEFLRPRKSTFGINSGLINNPLGVYFWHNFFDLNGLSVDAEWRFLTKNNYLNAGIRSPNFHMAGRWFSFRAGYKNVYFHQNDDRFQQIAGSLRFYVLNTSFLSGYAHNFRQTGEENRQQSGLLLGADRNYGRFHFLVKGIIWSDKSLQYRLGLSTFIPRTNFVLGLSHEQIFGYREWGVSLVYHVF